MYNSKPHSNYVSVSPNFFTNFNPKNFTVEYGLTEKEVTQLKELFDSIDLGGNGLISLIDLRAFIFNYTQFNAQNNTLYHIIGEYDTSL